MKIKTITFSVSGLLVLMGLIAFFQIARGSANLGVDFSGGSLLQYQAQQPFTMAEVRDAFHQQQHGRGRPSGG